AAQVRVHQAQAAEAAGRAARAADVGQDDLRRVSDEDVLDRAAPIDQHADLAMQLTRKLRHEGGELRRDDFVRRDAAPIHSFQRLDLARLESGEVSRHFFLHALRSAPAAHYTARVYIMKPWLVDSARSSCTDSPRRSVRSPSCSAGSTSRSTPRAR